MSVLLLHVVIFSLALAFAFWVERRSMVRERRVSEAISRSYEREDWQWVNTLARWPGVASPQSLKVDDRQARMFVGRSRMVPQIWQLSRRASATPGLLVAAVLVTAAPGVVRAADTTADEWSEFQNAGRLVLQTPLPAEWSPESHVAWAIDLDGYGQSTPLVHGDQVYVTTTRGANKEACLLTAYGLKTGDKRWQLEFANPTPEENNSYVSRAAPSPLVDAEQVVVLFEGGLLAAADHAGKQLWQRDLTAEFGPVQARHGLASSLVAYGEQAIAWVERADEPFLLSFDRQTGETLWKVAGLGATTWSTPRLVQVGEQQQLVCSASGLVVGFDPVSGQRLWELSDVSGNTSSTPMPVGDGLFFLGASQGRGEPSAPPVGNSNGLVKITQDSGGAYAADFVWRADKATCSFGSPVVAGDMVYEVNRSGVLYGLDVQTGAQKVQQRSGVESIWATPLVAEGQLYLFGRRGETSIIDLATHKVVRVNQLWVPEASQPQEGDAPGGSMGGHTLYAATVAGDLLLLRRGDKLFAIQSN